MAALLEIAVDALEGDRVRPPLGLPIGVGGELPDDLEWRVDEGLLTALGCHSH